MWLTTTLNCSPKDFCYLQRGSVFFLESLIFLLNLCADFELGLETEDEGTSSCVKLQVVLAVLLVVAVCQNTNLIIKINAKCRTPGFHTSGICSAPSFGRPPRVGGLPNSRSTTRGGHYVVWLYRVSRDLPSVTRWWGTCYQELSAWYL